jgi:hypothetical protein
MVMMKMSDEGNGETRAPRPAEDRPKPDPTEYGVLVDKMVATVAAWPREYQRSVDVHHLHVHSRGTA